MKIGKVQFDDPHRTYVCGILNVTPDSFSDGGKWNAPDRALFRAQEMIREGADLLDIGGESTRPGFAAVPAGEEIERVVPVIEAVKARFDIPVSLDTMKSETAQAGLQAGADAINDIWGFQKDPELAALTAQFGAACILNHHGNLHRDTLATESPKELRKTDEVMLTLLDDLAQSAKIAQEAGIHPDRILLDPGIGFGKTQEENLLILRKLEDLHALGFPVFLGCSRKSVIGNALDLPADERLEGTLATSVLAVTKKVRFVRVHDVKENVRAIKMTEAILYG